MVKLQLLNAGPKEISLIQHLADKIWKAHYPSIIGMEQVDYMLNRFYSEESMLEQMHLGQQFFLVELDNERVGFLSVSLVNEKEYFLNKFYIDADLHRKGIGTAVFDQLLKQVGDNVKTLRLQVNRQNYKPINFYFKLGFVIEKIADFDIGDGYFMNDFVMVWHAK